MRKTVNIHSINNPFGEEVPLNNDGTYTYKGITYHYRRGQNAVTRASLERQGSIFKKSKAV